MGSSPSRIGVYCISPLEMPPETPKTVFWGVRNRVSGTPPEGGSGIPQNGGSGPPKRGVRRGPPGTPCFFTFLGPRFTAFLECFGARNPQNHVFRGTPCFRPRFRAENGGVVLLQFTVEKGCQIWGRKHPQNTPEKWGFPEKTPPNMIYRIYRAFSARKKVRFFEG